jgi:pyrroloquinoline quinone biosynthesis protein D
VSAVSAYRLARGVKLRRQPDGGGLLLVPEGLVTLSDSATATLELVDGQRDVPDIARRLSEDFEADAQTLEGDVQTLLESFVERGYVLR